jgi:hypothetical protein
MPQALLAERFQLAVHKGCKEQPVYALVAAKKKDPSCKKPSWTPLLLARRRPATAAPLPKRAGSPSIAAATAWVRGGPKRATRVDGSEWPNPHGIGKGEHRADSQAQAVDLALEAMLTVARMAGIAMPGWVAAENLAASRAQRRLQLLIPPALPFSRPFNRTAFSLILNKRRPRRS